MIPVRFDLPPYLEVSGTFKNMGNCVGEHFSKKIKFLADERFDIICGLNSSIKHSDIKNVCLSVLYETEKKLPDVYCESAAVAMAAGIPHWMLLIAGGFSDIADIVSRQNKKISGICECTICPALTVNNKCLLAGTWDTHATAGEALIILRRRPRVGPNTLALTTVGWPMQQGVTSNGLAFAIANLAGKKQCQGSSYICILPKAAQQATSSLAASFCRKIKHCSARYYSFLDKHGNFNGVEIDGDISWTTKTPSAHTNHFIFSYGVESEGRPEIVESSERRRITAQRLAYSSTSMTMDMIWQMLTYNDCTEASINRYGIGREEKTCAMFIISPVDREINYAVRNEETICCQSFCCE